MTTCDEVRISLGVYVLGALESEECVLVEAHLAECAGCQAEFDELTGVAAFLGRVSEADVAQVASPPQAVLDRLLNAKVKRRRVTRALLSLAASVLLVGLGGTLWVTQSTPPEQGTSVASAPRSSAADGGSPSLAERRAAPTPARSPAQDDDPQLMLKEDTGERTARGDRGSVHATVTAVPGAEATKIKVMLTGVAQGTRCRVDVVAVGGGRETAGNWIVDKAAYDRAGAFNGTTTISPASISRFEIVTSQGRMLVSVPFP
ncbi:anti-sigma factor family protein [Streptosporangium sp. NBC_01756]|uniref:anti-sigma factor family protein n=1 Tax=Streptosporangium sp. NBC_01756 TaxID=2975950 RepID=UPI002DDB68FB|nr:zf-HC2 domain-containing protein [Streptosporangium sp. NBC_01756]WSC83302.1 zf-HC2 domain-containing protein [Streptosporangium sp. NBC_01756]